MAEVRLVEILGVAGSGKSTVALEIANRPEVERAAFISARNPRHLVHFVTSLPSLIPSLLANLLNPPRMSWADYKLMVYISSWHSVLTGGSRGTYVLDQGPLYALVRLRAKGLGMANRESFLTWWHRMLDQWIGRMSLVVKLDAPNEVLRARIDNRQQDHPVKGQGLEVSTRFLETYRRTFDEIVDLIESGDGTALLEFDTTTSDAGEIADMIIATLGSGGPR